MALAIGFLAIAAFLPAQLEPTALFTAEALVEVAPFLLVSIAIAAYAKRKRADALIARAFSGSQMTMIVAASLMGALSPFCSCGVIPLIAALLSMGARSRQSWHSGYRPR